MNSDSPTPPTQSDSPALNPARRRAVRKRNPYRHAERPGVPLLLTVPEAAETLRTNPEALRARLRRNQVVGADGAITSPLGPGIAGLKVGATWLVRFEVTK
jgi:hypothetical protein